MMTIFSKFLYRTLYKLRLMNSVSIAKKIGVSCGDNCQFLDDSTIIFGSEPYLVTVGNHVEITNGTRIITHDGGMWVFRDRNELRKIDYIAPVRIGNNVFNGINTIILPGVNIGSNVVI